MDANARPSSDLAARIEEHRAYLAQRRQEQPDPWEALQAFAEETFGRDALAATYEEYRQSGGFRREVDDQTDGR